MSFPPLILWFGGLLGRHLALDGDTGTWLARNVDLVQNCMIGLRYHHGTLQAHIWLSCDHYVIWAWYY